MKRIANRILNTSLALLMGSTVLADKTATICVETPTRPGTVKVRINNRTGLVREIPVPIAANDPDNDDSWQKEKRDAIAEAVRDAGYRVETDGDGCMTISGLPDNTTTVVFKPENTGERRDSVKAERVQDATVSFQGNFAPVEENGLPAVFTAGIITDIGELSVEITAEQLDFQTDGPIICQALFQRLAPRAPQYGAQINYAGDRLEIYFDPAYTVGQGGIVFGTSSFSPGCEGGVALPDVVSDPCPEDIDGDGIVALSDLARLLARFGSQCR